MHEFLLLVICSVYISVFPFSKYLGRQVVGIYKRYMLELYFFLMAENVDVFYCNYGMRKLRLCSMALVRRPHFYLMHILTQTCSFLFMSDVII